MFEPEFVFEFEFEFEWCQSVRELRDRQALNAATLRTRTGGRWPRVRPRQCPRSSQPPVVPASAAPTGVAHSLSAAQNAPGGHRNIGAATQSSPAGQSASFWQRTT